MDIARAVVARLRVVQDARARMKGYRCVFGRGGWVCWWVCAAGAPSRGDCDRPQYETDDMCFEPDLGVVFVDFFPYAFALLLFLVLLIGFFLFFFLSPAFPSRLCLHRW